MWISIRVHRILTDTLTTIHCIYAGVPTAQAWCQGQDLSCRKFLLFGPLYSISAPITVLSLAVKAVCCYGGDQQREQDQDRARALKIFEHLGEALPQLTISLVFLSSEGVFLHPLTVLSAVVSAISLMIGLVTGAVALYRRGLTV